MIGKLRKSATSLCFAARHYSAQTRLNRSLDIQEAMSSKIVVAAVFGGVALGFTGYAMRYSVQAKIRKSPYYQEAVNAVRNHPQVILHLGEPVEEGRVEVGRFEDFGRDDENAWVTVPVKGPKTTGKLKYWMKMDKTLEKIYISRIEVTFASIKNQKLLIMNKKNPM